MTNRVSKSLQNTHTILNNDLLEHDLVKYWLKNINSEDSRRSLQSDLVAFFNFFRIESSDQFKKIKRNDVIDWRDHLTGDKENPRLAVRTIKRRLSTISKFFEHLCDEHIIETNIIKGVSRPKIISNEGVTSAISTIQARDLLESPDPKTVKGKRDRAILATFLFHALRRGELCKLQIPDIIERDGIKQFKVHGKGDKIRYVPINPAALIRIDDYLKSAEHKNEKDGALFRPLHGNIQDPKKGISPVAIYKLVVHYGQKAGIDTNRFSPHSLRATAATNTLLNGEDLRRVQHWLGHANVQTTAMYDKRENRPEDSPTFRVRY